MHGVAIPVRKILLVVLNGTVVFQVLVLEL